MGNFTVRRHVDAPVDTVWEVLDDFGDIQRWNPGVTSSELVTGGAVGRGSERTCELKPVGSIKERITHHEPGEKMTIHIYEMSNVPLKEGIAEFSLAPHDGGTEVTIEYEYTPTLPGRLMGPMMRRLLERGLGGLLAGLKVESEKIAAQ